MTSPQGYHGKQPGSVLQHWGPVLVYRWSVLSLRKYRTRKQGIKPKLHPLGRFANNLTVVAYEKPIEVMFHLVYIYTTALGGNLIWAYIRMLTILRVFECRFAGSLAILLVLLLHL